MKEKKNRNRTPFHIGVRIIRRLKSLLSGGRGTGKYVLPVTSSARDKQAAAVTGPDFKWCEFGVRDPAVLSLEDGSPLMEEKRLLVYFNGRNKPLPEGGKTRVGRVVLSAGLNKVEADPGPVFEDGDYTALGSVLKVEGRKYWMFYSHGTDLGFRRAVSKNGIKWDREEKTLLTPGQFGCTRIGLPYVLKIGSQWVMLLEGIRGKNFRIFAAVSQDGAVWTPALGGEPVYVPAENEWDGGGQANPSLRYISSPKDGNGVYVLFYNGHAAGDPTGWDIGMLISKNMFGPWSKKNRPILARKDLGLGQGRLEGARLVHPPEKDGRADLLFFGLPGKDSYENGIIYISKTGLGDIFSMNRTKDTAHDGLSKEAQFNDKLALKYFDIWETYPIQKFTNELEGKWLKEMIQPGQSVLMAGSGGGREIEAVLGKAGKITAMDISPEMLRVGREKFPDKAIEWRLGDAHNPPQDLSRFDHIVALGGVFAYLNDPFQAARALGQRLVPGGMMTLCVMNSEHPTEEPGVKELGGGRVRRTYSVRDLRELLEYAGLDLETVRGFRFLVDNLPPEWNKNAASEDDKADILRRTLELESSLVELMPAEKGKFIWIIGKKKTEE